MTQSSTYSRSFLEVLAILNLEHKGVMLEISIQLILHADSTSKSISNEK